MKNLFCNVLEAEWSELWEELQINGIGVGTLKCDGRLEQFTLPWWGVLINTSQYPVEMRHTSLAGNSSALFKAHWLGTKMSVSQHPGDEWKEHVVRIVTETG